MVMLILLSSTGAALLTVPNLPNAGATTSAINLKAVLVTTPNDLTTAPYGLQTMENLLRDWGIPFDVVQGSAITAHTFWDSTHQVPAYQFIVVEGAVSESMESALTTPEQAAVTAAVNNGTNLVMVGPSVVNWGNTFFGYSNYIDCPTNPQYGGTCAGSATIKIKVNQTFTGPLTGDRTWTSGTVITGSGISNTAVLAVQPRNPSGVKEFMSYSVNGTTYPLSVFKKVGSNNAMVWWFDSIEGAYTNYRTGWQWIFAQSQNSNGQAVWQPADDMWSYILNNVTKYDVNMMSWGTDGSAQVIRIEDHVSLTSLACNNTGNAGTTAMARDGIQGEINWNLNGVSNSLAQTPSATQPVGVTNPQGTAGFRYWGTIGGGATGTNNEFELTAVVDNKTFIGTGGGSDAITTSHSVTVSLADGNTTTIQSLRVRVSTTSSPSWTLSFRDSKGNVLWTSGAQTTTLSSATWVKFGNVNFSGANTGYVNNLQGNDKLTLTVTTGTVTWTNQSSTQADWMVTGRSNWDIVYEDVAGTLNFAGDTPLVPDSIRMASGSLYDTDNRTVHFSAIPGEVHPADIVGEVGTGAPTGLNFETFFTPSDWASHQGQLVLQSCIAMAKQYGWSMVPNGWTHAKAAANSYDNDWYSGNGTQLSNAALAQRYNDIVSYFNRFLGSSVGTMTSTYANPSWVEEWAYGTSFTSVSPALQTLATGGFFYAFQDADQANGEVLGGYDYQNPTSSGCVLNSCNIMTVPLRNTVGGAKNSNGTWSVGFNETRSTNSISQTPADWTTPNSDYLLAKAAKLTQPYCFSCTAFTNNYDAAKFWNATLYAMTHTKTFQWLSSSSTLTFVTDVGTAKNINNTAWKLPFVIRLPETFQGSGLTSASDNQTSGSLANSTASLQILPGQRGREEHRVQLRLQRVHGERGRSDQPDPEQRLEDRLRDHCLASHLHMVRELGPRPSGIFRAQPRARLHLLVHVLEPGRHGDTERRCTGRHHPDCHVQQEPLDPCRRSLHHLLQRHQQRGDHDSGGCPGKRQSPLELPTPHTSQPPFRTWWSSTTTGWFSPHGTRTLRPPHRTGSLWFKTKDSIAHSAVLQMYIGFYSTSTNNYSPTGNWGEAPQLSGTYGQYDNGPKVFTYYQNFNGSSLPSSWSGSGYSVSNGLTLPTHTNYAYTTSQTFGYNDSQALDFYGTLPSPNSNNVWSCFGYVGQNTGSTCNQPGGRNFVTWATNYGVDHTNDEGIATAVGQGRTTEQDPTAPGTYLYSLYWPTDGSFSATTNYGSWSTVSGGQVPTSALYLGGASSANSNYDQQVGPIDYIRLRYYISTAPTVSFGLDVTVVSTVPLKLTVGEGGAPVATVTVNGCGPSPATITGDGTAHNVLMTATCSFTVGFTNSGSTRYGFITGGSFSSVSATHSSCASGTCTEVDITYDYQLLLTVNGGHSTSTSISSETSDGWYKYGDSLTVSSSGVYSRGGGTGQRVSSYNVDGGTNTNEFTTGTVTTSSVSMTAAHAVNFNSVTQYQVNLDAGATNALSSITSPTVGADNYWYDSATAVTLTLDGIYGRSAGAGTRLSSYSINGGAATPVLTTGTVSPLSAFAINALQAITTTSVTQYQITVSAGAGGTASATTSPTITGDTGWYDSATGVSVSATASGGYSFSAWTGTGGGSYTGSADPASVIMNAPILRDCGVLGHHDHDEQRRRGRGWGRWWWKRVLHHDDDHDPAPDDVDDDNCGWRAHGDVQVGAGDSGRHRGAVRPGRLPRIQAHREERQEAARPTTPAALAHLRRSRV